MQVRLSSGTDFRFTAENENKYTFDIGASQAVGGDDSGFRPMQLVLAAIGSCSGIDVITILKKQRTDFDRLQVVVEGERIDAVPGPFKSIHLTFIIHGRKLDMEKANRAISLAVDKYCSVAEMLKQTVQITHSIELSDA